MSQQNLIGGIVKLEYLPVSAIANWPESYQGKMLEDITLQSDTQWSTIPHQHLSPSVNIADVQASGQYYSHTLSFNIIGTGQHANTNFIAYPNIYRITDGNDNTYILGSPDCKVYPTNQQRIGGSAATAPQQSIRLSCDMPQAMPLAYTAPFPAHLLTTGTGAPLTDGAGAYLTYE